MVDALIVTESCFCRVSAVLHSTFYLASQSCFVLKVRGYVNSSKALTSKYTQVRKCFTSGLVLIKESCNSIITNLISGSVTLCEVDAIKELICKYPRHFRYSLS